MMNSVLEELKCVWEEDMGLCVTTSGDLKMPLWSADNLDSPSMVWIIFNFLNWDGIVKGT